jgi:hypothetical protein
MMGKERRHHPETRSAAGIQEKEGRKKKEQAQYGEPPSRCLGGGDEVPSPEFISGSHRCVCYVSDQSPGLIQQHAITTAVCKAGKGEREKATSCSNLKDPLMRSMLGGEGTAGRQERKMSPLLLAIDVVVAISKEMRER